MHNLNLTLRFLLEVVAFITPGFYIATLFSGFLSVILAILLPITLMATWGIFAVKDDPSRSGKTVVNTPGWVRLILELGIFFFGAWSIWELDYKTSAIVFGIVVVIHNLMFYERNAWLVKQ